MGFKILQVGFYTIENPIHGGQRRAREIFDFLSKSGHEVNYFSFGLYPFRTKMNKVSHVDFLEYINAPEGYKDLLSDLYFSIHSGEIPELVMIAKKILNATKPEIIIFEQPWLFPLFKKAMEGINITPFLVYSSHNVEYETKEKILSIYNRNEPRLISEVLEIEKRICSESDLTLAVSEEDSIKLKTLGSRAICLAKNTISKNFTNTKKIFDFNYSVFVGSAYPPNSNGFFNYLGCLLGWIPPGSKIVVCGGVSDLIKQDKKFSKFYRVNMSRLVFLHRPSDQVLNSILYHSNSVLLPIHVGGGTNLKTSEALQTGLPIIATSTALRGYEEFAGLPNINIADTRNDFITAVISTLRSTSQRVPLSESLLQKLTWDFQLKSFSEKLKNIKV
jgi:hypothetical protein